jgi:hypothetical protein
MSSRAVLAAAVLFGAAAAHADEHDIPFADTQVLVDREHGMLRVARVGAADDRLGRFTARLARARELALGRARDAIHAFVDEAAARRGLSPVVASALHRTIDDRSVVVATRALVDAGAVVVVELPLEALSEAGAPERFP